MHAHEREDMSHTSMEGLTNSPMISCSYMGDAHLFIVGFLFYIATLLVLFRAPRLAIDLIFPLYKLQ